MQLTGRIIIIIIISEVAWYFCYIRYFILKHNFVQCYGYMSQIASRWKWNCLPSKRSKLQKKWEFCILNICFEWEYLQQKHGRFKRENLNLKHMAMSLKSKWVWSGNTTITHCRPTHGTMSASHRTFIAARQPKENKNKVSKGTKIRNQYNQVPHLTQDTNGKVTNSQLDTTNESQKVSHFPAGDHKAHINRHSLRHSKAASSLFRVKLIAKLGRTQSNAYLSEDKDRTPTNNWRYIYTRSTTTEPPL